MQDSQRTDAHDVPGEPLAGGDDPRLPDRPAIVEFVEVDESDAVPQRIRIAGSSSRSGLTPIGIEPGFHQAALHEYRDRELARTFAWSMLVLVARSLVVVWGAWVVLAARSIQIDGITAGGVDEVVDRGRFGFVVAAAIAVTGWIWADRRIVNVHRLDARLPSRARAVTAWFLPIAIVVLASLLILEVEPTEPADVRPLVALLAFVAVVWRPYSLVRRIVASLTPAGVGALLGVAYVLDLAGFGILWWQLLAWSTDPDVGTGRVDIMVALGSVGVIALLINVVVWFLVLRFVRGAQAYRRRALRTRHEHRMLRLQGIDPLDPDIWWAMVHGEIAGVTRESGVEIGRRMRRTGNRPARPLRTTSPTRAAPPPVAPVEAPASTPPADEPRPGDVVPSRPEPDEPAVAARNPVDEPASSTPSTPSDDVPVGAPATVEPVDRPDEITDAEPRPTRPAVDAVDEAQVAARVESVVARVRRDQARRLDQLPKEESDSIVDELRRNMIGALHRAGTTEEGQLPERFAEMLREQPEPAGGNVPLAALRHRFSRSSDASMDQEAELQALLHRAGVVQVDAALARRAPQPATGDRMVRPRLLGLDVIRLLVVVCLGLATFLTLWTLDLALRAGANDELSARADRIDLARWAVLVAFAAANTCTVLWVGVAGRHLARAGIVDIGRSRWWIAAVLSAAATAASGALGRDLAEPVNLVLLAVPVVLATWASVVAVGAARAMQLRAIPHLVWTAAVPVVALVLALGRFGRGVTGDVSVGRLVFVGALVGVMWCVLIVLVALATSEFQDELKRAPALAVPAGRRR